MQAGLSSSSFCILIRRPQTKLNSASLLPFIAAHKRLLEWRRWRRKGKGMPSLVAMRSYRPRREGEEKGEEGFLSAPISCRTSMTTYAGTTNFETRGRGGRRRRRQSKIVWMPCLDTLSPLGASESHLPSRPMTRKTHVCLSFLSLPCLSFLLPSLSLWPHAWESYFEYANELPRKKKRRRN